MDDVVRFRLPSLPDLPANHGDACPVLHRKSLFSPHDASGDGLWDTGLPLRSEAPIVTPSGVNFSSSFSFTTFGVACRSRFCRLYSGLMYELLVQVVYEQGV